MSMMLIYALLAIASVLAGVSTVLFGFGGGFVIVPLLYHVMKALAGDNAAAAGAAMQVAVATSVCVMVVSSALATRRHARKGNIVREQLWPLVLWIGVGAVCGAILAMVVKGAWVRWAFVIYLMATIIDCLLRPGFIRSTRQGESEPAPIPSSTTTAFLGMGIGVIASCLGVGGSVMTVPLMRRRGLSMTVSTAMANPLTLPVGIAGAATYLLVGLQSAPALPGLHWGYVDLSAFALLVAGSLIGMRLAAPLIGRIPDRLHAQIYVTLLAVVMLGMLV